jgi:hypothetical protein
MTNAGNVIVNTGGTMTVTGNYTQSAGGTQVDGAFTGTAVNINAGTLSGNGGTITGPTSLAGVLRPGDSATMAGVLSISGAYAQAAAGAYNVAVGGLSAGSQFGQVNITSAATLNGTLSASLINGFSPVAGNSFTILNSGGRTGTFAATNLPALPCGGTWQVSYTTTSAVLSVVNPAPTISSLSPPSAGAGGPAFTLTVNGSGFVCGSTVKFNGNARTTTFVSPTQVTAAIPASDIVNTGSYNVTVTNAAPGGGTSNAAVFTVNNSIPTITSISPSSATAGGPAFSLTVNGTNFVSGSTVSFNGNARTTAFVSATQLTAAILAGDIATAGTYDVIVTNPSPGGGTSNAATFTVNNPVPTITTISPSSATAGGPAFTLTVNGTNFVSSSTVSFNGNARTTTFVSATRVTAAIPATDIATAGTYNVTVTNPSPGGGTSNAATFTVSGSTQPLTVTLAGTGSGTVTSSPSGINCPGTCSANFNTGTVVTLTASPASGSTFGGWSGACTGTGTCSVTMNASKSVTASFNLSGGPIVTLSTTSLSFGNQVINTTSVAKTVTLTNSGTGPLSISSIVVSGSFAIFSKTCGTTLAAAAKCNVKITFTPTVLGTLTGALTFTDNAPNSPQTVALTGKGVLPATLTPATGTYPAQAVGTTSAAKTFTLTNNQTVSLNSIAISTTGDFAISARTCTTSLAAKGKCTVSVTFTPTATGTRTGTLSVSDSASNSPQTVALTGKGILPATLTPATATYPARAVGTTSAAKTFTLTNNQTVSLNSIAISTTGDFAISATTCTTSLAAKGKCTVSVTFTPTATGTRTGKLSVSDTASNSPQTSNLTGTGK